MKPVDGRSPFQRTIASSPGVSKSLAIAFYPDASSGRQPKRNIRRQNYLVAARTTPNLIDVIRASRDQQVASFPYEGGA